MFKTIMDAEAFIEAPNIQFCNNVKIEIEQPFSMVHFLKKRF